MHDTRFNPRHLNQARLRAGMSQDDLAYKVRDLSENRVKANHSSVSDHERGVNTPTGETVVLYAAATGQSIEFFYASGAEEEEDEEKVALSPADDLMRALHRVMAQQQEVVAA